MEVVVAVRSMRLLMDSSFFINDLLLSAVLRSKLLMESSLFKLSRLVELEALGRRVVEVRLPVRSDRLEPS